MQMDTAGFKLAVLLQNAATGDCNHEQRLQKYVECYLREPLEVLDDSGETVGEQALPGEAVEVAQSILADHLPQYIVNVLDCQSSSGAAAALARILARNRPEDYVEQIASEIGALIVDVDTEGEDKA